MVISFSGFKNLSFLILLKIISMPSLWYSSLMPIGSIKCSNFSTFLPSLTLYFTRSILLMRFYWGFFLFLDSFAFEFSLAIWTPFSCLGLFPLFHSLLYLCLLRVFFFWLLLWIPYLKCVCYFYFYVGIGASELGCCLSLSFLLMPTFLFP